LHGNFFEPSTINEFVDVKRCATVWTLLGEIESKIDKSDRNSFIYLPLLHKPSADAAVATQFTAEWAQVCFLQFLHADKASKHIDEGLQRTIKKNS
jgi:hypothetical protein